MNGWLEQRKFFVVLWSNFYEMTRVWLTDNSDFKSKLLLHWKIGIECYTSLLFQLCQPVLSIPVISSTVLEAQASEANGSNQELSGRVVTNKMVELKQTWTENRKKISLISFSL